MKLAEGAGGFHCQPFPLSPARSRELVPFLPTGAKTWSLSRRQEWLAGRYCSKVAMEDLGLEWNGLESAFDRRPLWPKGVAGSITHSRGLAAALVVSGARGVGLDCEAIPDARMARLISRWAAKEKEGRFLEADPRRAAASLFSAKETLFKAVYPLCGCYFDFKEARLLALDERSFRLRLESPRKEVEPFNGTYEGRLLFVGDRVFSWIVLP